MDLYITLNSPYARLVRIMLIEKGLQSECKIKIATTRKLGSPFYNINPSGRVPYLVTNEGVGIEGSRLICTFLDHLDENPIFSLKYNSNNLELLRFEEQARATVESASVWIRELFRPEEWRSPTVIDHEKNRLKRLVDAWETQILSPIMNGDFNMAQMTLICALQLEIWNPEFVWRPSHPKLINWLQKIIERESVAKTMPPGET